MFVIFNYIDFVSKLSSNVIVWDLLKINFKAFVFSLCFRLSPAFVMYNSHAFLYRQTYRQRVFYRQTVF